MRTTIDTTNSGEVILCYDHPITGERVRRVFQCGVSCIREYDLDGMYTVTREALGRFGRPLAPCALQALPYIIRREWRKARKSLTT